MSIELRREGGIAEVALNRPDKLNALSAEMKTDLVRHFKALNLDHEVRVIVLTGRGRGFCSGGDVGTMGSGDRQFLEDRIRALQVIPQSLIDATKPTIALVRGAVAGAGFSIVMACDMIVASETAKFTMAFARVGVVPDGGGLYFLMQRVGLPRAKDLVMTARTIDAREAFDMGIVSRVVADDRLEAEGFALAQQLAAMPPLALAGAKRMFRSYAAPALEPALDLEMAIQMNLLESQDHAEGAAAFREKRKPVFKGL